MIEIKLVPTNYFTRWPCTICGGHTQKDSVLCEGETNDLFIRVCDRCLKNPEAIDAKIEQRAIEAEQWAARLRAVVGKLTLPSYEAWERAIQEREAEFRGDDDSDYEMPF